MVAKKTKKEETYEVSGDNLLDKVKELISEGNIRKITIKNKNEKVIAMFPLTVGVVGVLLAPVFAAIGVIATLIGQCSITVERK